MKVKPGIALVSLIVVSEAQVVPSHRAPHPQIITRASVVSVLISVRKDISASSKGKSAVWYWMGL
jgi:hypothetical protein